jgi:hypothetical protein
VEELAFIPGILPSPPGPLGRYLPPTPLGVIASRLNWRAPPGSWVLDPFGASPRLVVEAARAGYRVLVASNNPIDRFLIDLTANPPSETELRSSLADLGAALKGDQRIEPFLRNLYATPCNQCQQDVSAEAFIWERGATVPKSRIYHCPNCGENGEFPLSAADESKLAQLPSKQLHRSRALERVTALDDPDRALVEEALDVYLPRALYALFTLINKIENLSAQRRRSIFALLLSTFDQASVLWPHPTQRARPRQLTIPPIFRENNIWLAMEGSIEAWTQAYPAENTHLPLVIWPAQPPQSGGISLFEGRLKDLAEQWNESLKSGTEKTSYPIQAVITALPRPNQAYWTLSALWSGWLWGREAAAPIKTVLRRRRYDWNWHSTALYAAFNNLKTILQPGTPISGLISEVEPGFLAAALIAATLSGYELAGLALSQADNQAQIEWRQPEKERVPPLSMPSENLSDHFRKQVIQAAQEHLRRRGEPASYLEVYSAGLTNIISQGFPGRQRSTESAPTEEPSPAELLSLVQSSFQQALTLPSEFVRFHGSSKSIETGQWWLCESNDPGINLEKTETRAPCRQITPTNEIEIPLADRIEMEIVRLLVAQPNLRWREIDEGLANQFRGLFTPDPELIRMILESYAEPESPEGDLWRLRAQDAPRLRRLDIASISDLLQQIGARLGYDAHNPQGQRWILWQNIRGETDYAFYPLASAVIGKLVSELEFPAQHNLVVYPGGRAALLSFKLRRDPRLSSFIENGWQFVKFRHIRRLAEYKKLSLQSLDEQFSLDPMANQDSQIALI